MMRGSRVVANGERACILLNTVNVNLNSFLFQLSLHIGCQQAFVNPQAFEMTELFPLIMSKRAAVVLVGKKIQILM